jgi:hypothetical protein
MTTDLVAGDEGYLCELRDQCFLNNDAGASQSSLSVHFRHASNIHCCTIWLYDTTNVTRLICRFVAPLLSWG